MPVIELQAKVVERARHLGKALGCERSLRILSAAAIIVTRSVRVLRLRAAQTMSADTARPTGGDQVPHHGDQAPTHGDHGHHGGMGAARHGARLYFRCRARAGPFTSAVGTAKPRYACASCSSNTTFSAAFDADFGDLCHQRRLGRRGIVVALV